LFLFGDFEFHTKGSGERKRKNCFDKEGIVKKVVKKRV